jgi:hypothetical protein
MRERDPVIALAELSGAIRCKRYSPNGRPPGWNPDYTLSLPELLNDTLAHMKKRRKYEPACAYR